MTVHCGTFDQLVKERVCLGFWLLDNFNTAVDMTRIENCFGWFGKYWWSQDLQWDIMADFKLDHDGDVNDCIEEVDLLILLFLGVLLLLLLLLSLLLLLLFNCFCCWWCWWVAANNCIEDVEVIKLTRLLLLLLLLLLLFICFCWWWCWWVAAKWFDLDGLVPGASFLQTTASLSPHKPLIMNRIHCKSPSPSLSPSPIWNCGCVAI